MINSKQLVDFIDELLMVSEIEESSKNGLQVQGPDEIEKVCFAVDACLATIDEAARNGAQLLVVHHGLFWKEIQLVVDIHYRRLKALMDSNIGLYAAHLPLDRHPEMGNNRRLADLFGMDVVEEFGMYEGVLIGKIAELQSCIARDELRKTIETKLNTSCRLLHFGPETVRRVGIVSGGGIGLLKGALAKGCDAFITGESEHEAYHLALEGSINVYMAGHYATETLGLKAVQKKIEEEFGIETIFIDHPTGL